jgi:hypothetical protein
MSFSERECVAIYEREHYTHESITRASENNAQTVGA